MRLSMWLIADAWSDYSLTAIITDGTGAIEGIRFFTETSEVFEPDYVYVGNAAHVIPDRHYANAVMLAHKNDMIIVWNQEFEAVLNNLLSLFDLYNHWESTLWELSQSDDAVRKILKASESMLRGPTYISDRAADVLAMSENYGPDSHGDFWRTIYTTRNVPTATINEPILSSSGEYKGDWSEDPQIYQDVSGVRYIGAHIIVDEEPAVGICVLEADKPLNEGDLLVVSMLCDALTPVFNRSDYTSALSSRSMLGNILEGKRVDEYRFERLCLSFGLEKPLILILMRNVMTNIDTERNLRIIRNTLLLKNTRGLKTPSMGALYASDVAFLVSSTQLESFLDGLSGNTIRNQYSIGISLPFYRQQDIYSGYKQALFALEQCDDQPGVYRLEDFAYVHILSMLQTTGSDVALYHPALALLEDYDHQHKAELYKTFHCYLMNERNSIKAAEALDIHRNTMRNRLDRLEELLPDVDLGDPKIRQHIILSYLMRGQTDMPFR